jgi:hypothetical protein
MVTANPVANDRRMASRQRKLGPNAACAICGERDAFALILNGHHIGLNANDPTAVCVVCLNHHAIAHERLRRIGLVEWESVAQSFLERQAAMLHAEADFLRLLADSRDSAARELDAFAEWLDDQGVAWREWKPA